MIEEHSFESPHIVEAKGIILQGHYFFSFSHEVDELFHHILEVFVAPVVVDHSFNDPLVYNFVIKIAAVDPPKERSRVSVEDSSVAFFHVCFNILENY